MTLFARFLAARIARHDARAKVFGAACAAAQARGDRANVGRFHSRMCEAQALRDALIAKQHEASWSVQSLPNGDFEVVT